MGLVNWKQKRDKYDDDDDSEHDDEAKDVKFAAGLKEVKFIKSDSVNANAMKIMGGKWKW